MNVLNYLNSITEFDISAQEAYILYNSLYPNVSKFGYFRTQYNNKRRFLGIGETKEPIVIGIKEKTKIELKSINYSEIELSNLVTNNIPTGTFFDTIISEGGFVRKSVDAVAAKAGSGKTWSRISLASEAVKYNPKIKAALLSGEMLEHEIAKEITKSPNLKNLDFVYLVNYFREHVSVDDYWYIIEECFKKYDILVIDSFSVIYEQLSELYEGTIKAKKLLFLLTDRITKWAEKYDCNVQLILQCKRDGTYLGSSSLVHAISSLSYVHIEGQSRVIEFEKNRNNGLTVNRKLYFSKNIKGEIEFNMDTYKATYEQIADKKENIRDFLMSKNLNREKSDESESNIQERGLGGNTDEELAELDNHFKVRNNSSEVLENNTEIVTELAEMDQLLDDEI
jgi:hypothetical protein